MALRFLLCDDHALFREGLAVLLERREGWQVVGQAADGEEAVRLAAELQPDLILLDVAMPGMSGIEAASALRAVSPHSAILALSMYGDAHYRRSMLAAGAVGYLLKNQASAELEEAIAVVQRGHTFLSPALCADEERSRAPELELTQLTPRERAVLRLLAQSRKMREIAEEMGISVKTIETHRSRIMSKLEIDNLPGLVRFAIRSGLIPPEN
ncbi:MAG: response regulator transcription factor [Candidatus Competibacteraceae bacterium]|nr:response regulator transcription factor [Candidatus Competibacteraceae bacterium]